MLISFFITNHFIFSAIYDGSYIGDNLSEGDPSLKNAAGFFKSGFFLLQKTQLIIK